MAARRPDEDIRVAARERERAARWAALMQAEEEEAMAQNPPVNAFVPYLHELHNPRKDAAGGRPGKLQKRSVSRLRGQKLRKSRKSCCRLRTISKSQRRKSRK